ncbi:MAG: hypothetical protein WCT01_03740 [Candidatus Shapirobacteria bacterium]
MVYIFHGSDPVRSRQALLDLAATFEGYASLRLEGKEINLDLVNNHLNSTSLFADQKLLILFDFFQANPTVQKPIIPILQNSQHVIIIYAPKALTPAQLNTFPKAKVTKSSLSSTLFQMLNALRPHNSQNFYQLLNLTLEKEPVELVTFMIRRKLRELLIRPSGFNQPALRQTYLELINADFLIKSGQTPLSLEVLLPHSLSRIL